MDGLILFWFGVVACFVSYILVLVGCLVGLVLLPASLLVILGSVVMIRKSFDKESEAVQA
jgi:hypothetical protein